MNDRKVVGRSADRFQACARGCRLCAASKNSALLRWSRQKGRSRHAHTRVFFFSRPALLAVTKECSVVATAAEKDVHCSILLL